MKAKREIIGWSEYVDYPDWKISGVKAKVDTGARTSALHVEELKVLKSGMVQFYVILSRKDPSQKIKVRTPLLKKARVRSSTGEYSTRCFVKTRIRIGHIEKEIELSLVSRKKMLFRMLLGRKALEHDFLVDVNKREVLSANHEKSRKRKPKKPKMKVKEAGSS